MGKKPTAMFLLSLCIILLLLAGTALSADKQLKATKDRPVIPARFAPVYSLPGLETGGVAAPASPPAKFDLRNTYTRQGTVETVGSTTYDYQQNCTMGHQVEHRAFYATNAIDKIYGIYIHFDWMAQTGDTLGAGRGVGYQAYEISTCSPVFNPGGIRIESDYAGYATMDAHNLTAANSWGIPCAHQDPGDGYIPRAYWDFQAGGPVFGIFTDDHTNDYCGQYLPDCDGRNIWPKVSWDIDGSEQVLHMVTEEFGGEAGDPQTISYYRRVGPYGTGSGTWSDQRVVDTVMNVNATVVSSPISDRAAIVWNAPVDYKRDTPDEFGTQYENDVWYCMVSDNGADWGDNPTNLGNPSIGHLVDIGTYEGGNITLYNPMDDYKAYCDMSALFALTTDAPNDELHILWGCRRWTDTTSLYRRQSAIYHWRESTGDIKTVVRADWDSGGACYAHAWGSDVAKMSLSECDGKLYMSFTQFGDRDHPCDWYDATNNVVSGYMYITVYDPIYGAWDRPQRVTDINENPTGCTPGTMAANGDCNSEYWGSMARYGRFDTCKTTGENVLDILYINDYAPGGCIQTESGVWTVNDVNWVVYPCREAVPEPGYSDNAGPGYGLCYGSPLFWMLTTQDTTFILKLEDFGILANGFAIVAQIDSSNGPSNGANTSIGVNPAAGTIPGGGGAVDVTVSVSTAGEDDFHTVYATITVTHEAEGSPRVIPMCIYVNDNHGPLDDAIIATTCKQLKVYNNGQMSNNASNASLDYMDDPDDCAAVYLYDASPIICRDIEGTTQCYFAVYDNDFGTDHAMHQVSPMVVDEATYPDYTYATAEFMTGDSAIGLIVEYYAPKAAEDCNYVIQKLKFWNKTEVTLTGVAAGEALDWDIPSYEHGSNNYDGSDQARNLIYQYCACDTVHDPCDTLQACERYGGIAAWGGMPFKNYMVLENEIYVYTSGPFGNDAPLPDDTIFGLMTGNDGFVAAPTDTCEDLFTLVTFGVYDLVQNDTMCVVKILTTSKEDAGGSDLASYVDAANLFIDGHEEIQCPIGCDCTPGDANGDGTVNVGDAVYIISYVFKGGPAPTPWNACSGDANGDCTCNVGDAVYEISYVFKGGPPPVSCEEWKAICGAIH